MRSSAAIAAFRRAPANRKRLALEVVAELALARLMTLLPARIYTRSLGQIGAAAETGGVCPQSAEEIGQMAGRVAAALPFRARCLEQAIAIRRMLVRRGIKSTVSFGVNRDSGARSRPKAGEAAHVWVEVGPRIVAGDGRLDRFVVVARFS